MGAGSQTSMKSATSAISTLASTKSSSCKAASKFDHTQGFELIHETLSSKQAETLASLKCFPRLVYSALVLVKIPMPTCRLEQCANQL